MSILHTADATSSSHSLLEAALEVVLRVHSSRPSEPAEDVLVFCTGQEEIATAAHALRELIADLPGVGADSLLVLPLHASLPPEDQALVFAPAPRGARKVILATNVAETSLTIPGVRVIVDLGLCKEKRYDAERGMDL